MRATVLVLAVAALVAGCRKVPVRDVYCDGTSNWTCADPAFPRCDVQQKLCEPALVDAGTDFGIADLAGCTTSSDCPDDRPICDGRVCRACSGSGDDSACLGRSSATPRCFAASGSCAACATAGVESSDCATAAPVCGAGGVCRACGAHAECSGQLCNLDGTCAAAATIAYANNANGTCTGSHAATLADPACDITAALAVQPLVRVTGSTTAYPPVTISGGSVEIIGADTKPSALIRGDSTVPAFVITGSTTTVLLDELEVTSGTAQDGIACSNGVLGPTLVVRRSVVHGAGAVGIDATKCTVKLDRDQIGPGNVGGGISVGGGSYTISNCFVTGNGNGSAAVLLGSGATAISPGFIHNTVVNNAGIGINCAGAMTTIANSIVEGNAISDTSGACTLSGSTSLVPDFVSATDYHLNGRTTANLACCIDQLTTSPVDHDYDGRARPQPTNGKWDVGAHEVP